MNADITHPISDRIQSPPSHRHLASLGRFLAVALSLALLSLFFSSSAAAGVDGKYKYVSASGSLSIAGQTVNISRNDLKAVMANKAGYAVIKNSKIRFDAEDSGKLIKKSLKGTGAKLKISVNGPKSLKLRKAGKGYVGTGKKQVVVKIKGKIQGQSLNGKIIYNFKPKVKGDKLTFTVPVSGSLRGYPIKGKIRIVCKR